jgi:hypothetical protein
MYLFFVFMGVFLMNAAHAQSLQHSLSTPELVVTSAPLEKDSFTPHMPQTIDLTVLPDEERQNLENITKNNTQETEEAKKKKMCLALHEARFSHENNRNTRASVPADYIPEVDVYGRPVKGANLNGPTNFRAFASPVQIPIELDIIEYMGLSLSPQIQNAAVLKPTMAFISVYEDGRVMYNNQDIQNDLSTLCAP